ncbi:MAG: secretin and TonB N-terminal domain-containing protein [Hydrogenophilaceae bacterium]|nr:secretin and TonB N-terminal domain-containing protein [Hydrogenophilaceae bacterium]
MKKTILPLALAAVLATGCATDRAYREGERLIREGKAEEGLKQLEQAVKSQPDNVQYRATYARSLETQIVRLLAEGDAALKAGRLEEAQARYRDVLKLHPENARAPAGLASVEQVRRSEVLLREAQEAVKRDDIETARYKLRTVLAQAPDNEQALVLLKLVDEKAGKPEGGQFPRLSSAFRRPVTLEFRDAPIRAVFDALSRQSGINFVFDKDVRTDQKTTVLARNTAIADALDMLLATSQLAKKVLNDNTLLVYPNQPAKQKEYEELVVRAFFLANIDAKGAMNLVKTLSKTRDVYVDEKLNLLFVRDTPEAVRLVEKLLAVADQPEPEVMLEVEILEVKRSKLLDLGVQWPTQFSVLAREDQTQAVAVGTSPTTVNTKVNAPLTVDLLKGLDGSNILVGPTPSVNVRKDDSDVNILANPRIRVRNKEKAKVHIGDKVPVITANVTSTGVTSESVAYLDVGLKLDVEPQIYLDSEVAMKVGLEVSNIVREVKSSTGMLTYQLGSRNANTVLRLKNGETQVLAGLISDEDRSAASKVPGLGDLPLLGRLFSTHRDERNKTEIVLLITPRVLRNLERPELTKSEFFAGTEGSASDRPLMLRPAASLPAREATAQAASPAPPVAVPAPAPEQPQAGAEPRPAQ